MTTIRYTAIKSIETKLKTILTVNGFNYDLGENVFIGEPKVDSSFSQFLVIWPSADESNDNSFYSKWMFTMPLKIEAIKEISKDSDDLESISQNMLDDITACMFNPSITGIENSDIKYSGGGIETYPKPGETVLGVVANYEIEYNTTAGDLTSP